MNRKTVFSPCRRYRYTWWREWDMMNNSYCQFIALNPSTADETHEDPSCRRMMDYAKRWGFGAVCVTNAFAWRDTDPRKMKAAEEPVGPENDRYLIECAAGAGIVIAAWGKHGAHLGRADAVLALIPSKLHALKLNGDGSPAHPLYLSKTLIPFKI